MKLQRFVDAQAGVYDRALAELREGRKQSHWMWFVFPQIAGLGASPMARAYAIQSIAEAQAYLAHPLLGPRLRECCQAMQNIRGQSARDVLGAPDDLKFRSSMTLFAEAAPDEVMFYNLLDKYFDGEPDERTLEILARQE
ncbi:MAG TPA: DUF1810 domain-containing protein [Rhizomicrobium sp.]